MKKFLRRYNPFASGSPVINANTGIVEQPVVRRGGNCSLLAVLLIAAMALMLGVFNASAVPPDASDIVTTANTTFETVGALVAAAVGFFIIVKIVKWVRK